MWTSSNGPVVALAGAGRLRGTVQNGVVGFLNIPYAAASCRWKPPQPTSWKEERPNPTVLSRFPQPGMAWTDGTFEGHSLQDTEDALVVNVWTPEVALPSNSDKEVTKDLLPIVFYIHGGAGKFGHCHAEGIAGHQLVADEQANVNSKPKPRGRRNRCAVNRCVSCQSTTGLACSASSHTQSCRKRPRP